MIEGFNDDLTLQQLIELAEIKWSDIADEEKILIDFMKKEVDRYDKIITELKFNNAELKCDVRFYKKWQEEESEKIKEIINILKEDANYTE